MNIIICDDDELYLYSARDKINAWADRTGHSSDLRIHLFTSSEDLLDAWHHGLPADALFLDIRIPFEMNGLAVAGEIHCFNEHIPVVFMTDYGEYATEGYKVNALRFLHKPITTEAIDECMELIWHRWSLQNKECVLLDISSQLLRLPTDAILYIEMKGHYCSLNTTSNITPNYQFKLPLRQIQERLPEELFVQCHRSYIVNLMYVRHMEKDYITMSDNTTIPVSRRYQKNFVSRFRHLYIGGNHATANP